MTELRDYRDPADIDDQLDAIRAGPRDTARDFYIACLNCAYQQGRIDRAEQTLREAVETDPQLVDQFAIRNSQKQQRG